MPNKHTFLYYVMAGYPVLWIQTHEEHRAMATFTKEIALHKEDFHLYSWDRIDGVKLRGLNKNGVFAENKIEIKGKTDDPTLALNWIGSEEIGDNTILFLQDFHHYTDRDYIQRKIKNLIPTFKSTGKMLVIISHALTIPSEIEKEVTVINFKLPGVKEFKIVLQGICESISIKYPKDDLPVLEAALGMTTSEAENAFCLSAAETKEFDVGIINREKAAVVKKTGLLEVIEVKETIDDIGGLDQLKKWLTMRTKCFSRKAKEFPIKSPRGALFVGPAGTGKSLTAKVIASIWKRPLLRLDMGSLFGSLLGETESNTRKVIEIVEAAAPCILWLDELEKAFASYKGGGNHEASNRLFATLLTWMSERESDVFIAATSNNATILPGELIRAGRIDTVFYVDLPQNKEREKIISIHLNKAKRDPKDFNLKKLVKATSNFSGSEIEVWINETMVISFSEDHDLTTKGLIESAKDIPLNSLLYAEDIRASHEWANRHKVKPASTKELAVQTNFKRKMSLDTDTDIKAS